MVFEPVDLSAIGALVALQPRRAIRYGVDWQHQAGWSRRATHR
jgi:hypothetical protein